MKNPVLIVALSALPVALFSCDDWVQRPVTKPVADSRPDSSKVLVNLNNLDGKALFMSNCASCHNPIKDATGPALNRAIMRWGFDTVKYRAFVRNSSKVIGSGNKYAKELFVKWDKTVMTAFPNLSDKEIDAIIIYTDKAPQYSY